MNVIHFDFFLNKTTALFLPRMHSFLVGMTVAVACKCSGAVWALVRPLTRMLYCMSLQNIAQK